MQSPTQVVGRRVGAYLIDAVIVIAIGVISWFALTKTFSGGCAGGGVEINGDCRGFQSGSSNRTIWLLIVFLLPVAIYWVQQGLTGKTPGKAAVGIKVVNAEGNPPGVGRAALRSILWIVDGIVFNLVGFITALNSD